MPITTSRSALTLTSQTGYNKDILYSTEDYNRFNTAPGLVRAIRAGNTLVGQDGEFCDPQLGCSSRLVGEDVSQEHAQQFSQECGWPRTSAARSISVAGANYLHYQTVEDYYVFYNVISLVPEKSMATDSAAVASSPGCAAYSVRRVLRQCLQSVTRPIRQQSDADFSGFGCA